VRPSVLALAVLFPLAAVAQQPIPKEPELPPNNIDCFNWRNDGGRWIAIDPNKSFYLGSGTGVRIDAVDGPGIFAIGGFDLWRVLNRKCAGQ
jgi:hypothetical protein